MRWLTRKYPMRNYQFTFQGANTLMVRTIETRANHRGQAEYEAQQFLNVRYDEPHFLYAWEVLDD